MTGLEIRALFVSAALTHFSGSANILMLKEHFVWFFMRPHLTGLLNYLIAFLILCSGNKPISFHCSV